MSKEWGQSEELFKEICLFKIYYPEIATPEATDAMTEGLQRVGEFFRRSPAYTVRSGPFLLFRQLIVPIRDNQEVHSFKRVDRPLTVATLSFKNVLTDSHWNNRSIVIPDNNKSHFVHLCDVLSSTPLDNIPYGDEASPLQRAWSPEGILITPAAPRLLASFHLLFCPAERAITGTQSPPCLFL